MTWYLARRHLQYGIDEWESLPWWQQLVYADKLVEEFFDEDAEVPSEVWLGSTSEPQSRGSRPDITDLPGVKVQPL